MRILRSIHTLNPVAGGPIESVRRSSAALNRLGHEVEIISVDAPDAPWLNQINCNPRPWSGTRELRILAAVSALDPPASPGVRCRARSGHLAIHQLCRLGAGCVIRQRLTSFSHTACSTRGSPGDTRSSTLRKDYTGLSNRVSFGTPRRCSTLQKKSCRPTSRTSLPVQRRSGRLRHGSPGVDLEKAREQFLEKFPRLKNRRLVIFLGRSRQKGCELLLEAFASIRQSGDANLHLVFAGPTEPSSCRIFQRLSGSLFS